MENGQNFSVFQICQDYPWRYQYFFYYQEDDKLHVYNFFLHISLVFLLFSPVLENLILQPPWCKMTLVLWMTSMMSGKLYEWILQLNDAIRIFMNECINSYTTIKYRPFINPSLHRYMYSFLRLLQQTTFETIVTKEDLAPAEAFQLKKCSFFFSRVNFQDLSKCRLLQDCCMGERIKESIKSISADFYVQEKEIITSNRYGWTRTPPLFHLFTKYSDRWTCSQNWAIPFVIFFCLIEGLWPLVLLLWNEFLL